MALNRVASPLPRGTPRLHLALALGQFPHDCHPRPNPFGRLVCLIVKRGSKRSKRSLDTSWRLPVASRSKHKLPSRVRRDCVALVRQCSAAPTAPAPQTISRLLTTTKMQMLP